MSNDFVPQAVLDAARDGMIALDLDGQMTAANTTAQDMLDVAFKSRIGESLTGALKSAGSDVHPLADLLNAVRQTPDRVTQLRFKQQHERVLYLEAVASPILDEGQTPCGHLVALRDITEQELLQAEHDEMVYALFHDLRSPLASMVSALTLAKELHTESAGHRGEEDVMGQLINLSLISATHLMNAANDQLDVIRLQNHKLTLDRFPTLPSELVRDVGATLVDILEKARVSIEVSVPNDLPLVEVDSEKIRRVIENLLEGAVRYSPVEGKIHITAEQAADQDKVTFHVIDSGLKISLEDRAHIFDKPGTARAGKPVQGKRNWSPGLTYCKLMVEAHGERLWVEDHPQGTCFTFTLPAARKK